MAITIRTMRPGSQASTVPGSCPIAAVVCADEANQRLTPTPMNPATSPCTRQRDTGDHHGERSHLFVAPERGAPRQRRRHRDRRAF
jgi:hypothetical protein